MTGRRGTLPGVAALQVLARRFWAWLALAALLAAAVWHSGYPADVGPTAGPRHARPPSAGSPAAGSQGPAERPQLPVSPAWPEPPAHATPARPIPLPVPDAAAGRAVTYRIVPLTAAPRSLAAAHAADRERRVLYVLARGPEDWLLLAAGAAPHAGYHLVVDSIRETAGAVTVRGHLAVTEPAPAQVSYPQLLLAVSAAAGRRGYRLELDGVAVPTVNVAPGAGEAAPGENPAWRNV